MPWIRFDAGLRQRQLVKKSSPQMIDSELTWFPDVMAALIARRELTREQMQLVMQGMIAGQCGELEAAALLTALRMKGETAGELAAAATVLRGHMVRLETGGADVIDTCGTGGDETGTFNISTAAAFVVAGAGQPVVKHGNRAVSSRSGSSDVLTALGIPIQEDPAAARRCLEQAGLAFCFAPHFHPALRHLAPLRRRLRIRTLFNCLGPLANPALASYQLLGVGRPEMLDPMAGALALLGIKRAFLVCGADGFDEVSLSTATLVREVRGGQVIPHEWNPADFGLAPCEVAELRVASAQESAALIKSILNGQEGAATRVVIANAAAALLAAEKVGTLADGVKLAIESLQSGRARRVLESLLECLTGS